MDNFDIDINNLNPTPRRRTTERRVHRHDVPDPTPVPNFDESDPVIQVIEDERKKQPHPRQQRQISRHDISSDTVVTDREPAQRPKQKSTRRQAAPANTPRTNVLRKTANGIMDRRLHIFVGLLLCMAGIVLGIVLISHLYNAASDQSSVLNRTVQQMAENPGSVNNVAGAFGAWLSHVLFADALGLGAFVLAIYLTICGAAILGKLRINIISLTFKSLLLAVTISIVSGLVTYEADTAVFWGGTHGQMVNHYLFSTAGVIGAFAISILLIAAVACVFYHPLKNICKTCARFVPSLRRSGDEAYDLHSRRNMSAEKPLEDSATTNFTIDSETNADTTENDSSAFSIDNSEPDNGADKNAQISAEDIPFDVNVPSPETTTVTQPVRHASETGFIDPRAMLSNFVMPGPDLLIDRPQKVTVDEAERQANKNRIVKTLKDYNIDVVKISATVGPTITLYEIIPSDGTRIAQIKRLEDDIAMALAANGIRIIAPMPGKGTVGIEVPNNEPQTVSMRTMLTSKKFVESTKELPVALGATISNDVFVADLTKMPHLLVAGATGQGKSVGLNAIIASLIYKKHPTQLKFVLIDPKMLEFSLYAKLEKHYLATLPDSDEDPIITDTSKVLSVLNSLCLEMDNRYALMKAAGVREIISYNEKFCHGRLSQDEGHKYMPYIVVIIDEFADLMLTGGKEIEPPVMRITAKARAAGIHMIIATQRPSTNVLTGLIKANCPARIAFRVQQMVDSRCILDRPGANKLIGRGDMLYSSAGGALERMQCAFISTEEVENIVDFVNNQPGVDTYLLPDPLLANTDNNASGAHAGPAVGSDPLFADCARFLVSQGPTSKPSTSSLQRKFQIGYNRAGKIMDMLETCGIISSPRGPMGVRSLLVDETTLNEILSHHG